MKEAALGLPQLGLEFLANGSSRIVSRKPQNCEADAQRILSQQVFDNVLAQPSVLFQLG